MEAAGENREKETILKPALWSQFHSPVTLLTHHNNREAWSFWWTRSWACSIPPTVTRTGDSWSSLKLHGVAGLWILRGVKLPPHSYTSEHPCINIIIGTPQTSVYELHEKGFEENGLPYHIRDAPGAPQAFIDRDDDGERTSLACQSVGENILNKVPLDYDTEAEEKYPTCCPWAEGQEPAPLLTGEQGRWSISTG